MTDYERTEIETRRADTHVPVEAESRRVTERYVERGPGPASVAARVVVLLFGILQALLILRIILLLLIANPGNDIVAFILSATDPFVEPFRGMFALDRVTGDQGSQLDVAAIVALIGWTLIEALILAALRIFSRRPADTV
ncbi:MAG TPA: YggT family protein [Clostridia bacterium]|nr:YggT family protein [Clostridia bacterium]